MIISAGSTDNVVCFNMQIPEQVDDNFEGEEDSSVEGEESNAPRFAHCYTPNTAQSRVGAPTSHTPNLCDYLTTPDLKSGLKRYIVHPHSPPRPHPLFFTLTLIPLPPSLSLSAEMLQIMSFTKPRRLQGRAG